MFWFKVGLSALIYGFLDGPGLPPVLLSYDVKAVVFYGVSCCLWMTVYGWRLFKVFLSSLTLVSLMSLLYIHHNPDDGTGSCKLKPLLLSLGSWSLGFMRTCFIVVFPLKCTCIPYLLHVCFILLAIPFVYRMTICPTWPCFLGLLMVGLLSWLLLLVFPLSLLPVLWLLVELLLLVSSLVVI